MTFKSHDFPKEKVFNRWLELNPDWKIEFSTDDDCIEFIDKHFGQEYVDLFNHIKSGANKADLWRLCKLYVEGGVYTDIDIIPFVSIEEMIGDSDFCTCLAINRFSIFQAFIWVKEKENPLLKKFLESLLDQKYRYNWLSAEPTLDMYRVMRRSGIDVKCDTFTTELQFDNQIKELKIRILEEYIPNSEDWTNSQVRLNDTVVMKSRDIDYFNSKMNNIIWN